MTACKNFIQDFPTRCCAMLHEYESEALSSGKEVTLTLAMAGLVGRRAARELDPVGAGAQNPEHAG